MSTTRSDSLLQNGERWIALNGISHWCRIAGAEHQTTPLVIVHGGPGGHLYDFERLMGRRIERFATVIYYEQRGSGRSGKPDDPSDYSIPLLVSDLEALRQELGVERIIPLGISFGGWLAMEYALAHPTRVAQLVLVGPALGDERRNSHLQLNAFKFLARGVFKERVDEIMNGSATPAEQLNQIWNHADRETVDRLLFYRPEVAEQIRRLWNESGLTNTGDMHRALQKQTGDPRVLERLPELPVPTLCIVGLHDRNTGMEMARDIVWSLPDARLVIFEESAHFPDADEPDRFEATLRDFLSR